MKRCPTCNRTYTDLSLNFCLEDGTPLATEAPGAPDPNATLRYPSPRDTAEPPPTEIYHPPPPVVTPRPPTPPPPPPPPQWSPTPAQAPRKKSNAIWWILGGLAAVVVIGAGLVIMLIALASLGSDPNSNNLNTNNREVNNNRNVNVNVNANTTNVNTNANVAPSGTLVDDFSEKKWAVGVSQFGRIWYDNDQYHMSSKDRTYIVMYAPSDDYNTENATVKVTARSVDGDVPSAGFGLLVHGGWSKAKRLEDYALLIFPGDEPSYEIIKHIDGEQKTVVTRTRSDAIRTGSNPNELEIRIKGSELSFYANGEFLTRITDTENYKRGRAGFYTSDEIEVAFDNLEIDR